jgi:hypothetical protein
MVGLVKWMLVCATVIVKAANRKVTVAILFISKSRVNESMGDHLKIRKGYRLKAERMG